MVEEAHFDMVGKYRDNHPLFLLGKCSGSDGYFPGLGNVSSKETNEESSWPRGNIIG